MSQSRVSRTNLVFLLAILLASSVTMLWLFWRFPIATAIATVAVLTMLGKSARLAQSLDSEAVADLGHREQGIQSHELARETDWPFLRGDSSD